MRHLAATQRAQREDLQCIAQDGTADHGSNQSWENPKACLCDEEQPDVSADHEDPAMRHVDDVQYTENQRVADGDDRIGASQR